MTEIFPFNGSHESLPGPASRLYNHSWSYLVMLAESILLDGSTFRRILKLRIELKTKLPKIKLKVLFCCFQKPLKYIPRI